MQLVTARLMVRHLKYAVLVSFIVAAALTPSPDPWNQALFSAPILGLYVISIGIAWLVAPGRLAEPAAGGRPPHLKQVFAAAVIDHAQRRRTGSQAAFSSVPAGPRHPRSGRGRL